MPACTRSPAHPPPGRRRRQQGGHAGCGGTEAVVPWRSQRRRSPLLPLLAVLLLAVHNTVPAAAIFEDQVGSHDWYKQFVGRPTAAGFLPGKQRAWVATAQGLLASLTASAGAVAWRRPHTSQDALEALLVVQAPPLVVAASGGGRVVRAWDALEGNFRWEAAAHGDGDAPAAAAAAAEGRPPRPAASGGAAALAAVQLQDGKSTGVAVAAGDTIQLLGASKGDVLWSASLPDGVAAGPHKLLVTHDGGITAASYSPGSRELHLAAFAVADGAASGPPVHLAAGTALGSTATTSGSSIAVVSADGLQLCTATAGAGGDVSCQRLASLVPDMVDGGSAGPSSSNQLQLAPADAGSFTLAAPAGVALLSVGRGGAARLVRWFAGAAAASPGSASAAGGQLVALASSSADGSSVRVTLVDTATGKEAEAADVAVPAPPFPTSGPAARVVAAWLDASGRKEAGADAAGGTLEGCRLLLLWSDDRLSFVQRGAEAWSREEALAAGTSSIMVDLAAAAATPAAGGSDASSVGSPGRKGGLLGLLQDRAALKQWVRLQVLGVLIQFKLNTEQEREEFLTLRQALSDNNLPTRDTNGFRKLIILLTAPGKVFALHTGDGRVMWASNAAAAAAGDGQQQQHLVLWRRFHDLTHAPQIAVLSTGRSGASAHVLNGHTGQQLDALHEDYTASKVIPLPGSAQDGAAEQFSFLLVEQQAAGSLPRARLLPDTPATRARLANTSSSTFFWLQEQQAAPGSSSTGEEDEEEQTLLAGYTLAPQAAPSSGGLLPVLPAWQAALPGRLLATASKAPGEPLYSYVKVLGDRSLKYKYANPNLLFVATSLGGGEGPGSGSSGSAGSADAPLADAGVSVALINAVSGAVVYQQVHASATGPVHGVVSEHWVVYTLWDAVNLRQQVTVIELYDASPRDLSIASILSGATQHATALSSYASVDVEALSQSFYLQHAVKGLSVSQTRQGITTKQLLLHTVNDQVYALDKRFLDPRRPLAAKATPEQAEEGLMPYSELLVFNTLAYASQDKQIAGLRRVLSVPAVLESNSHLFAYGSELFYTRITPAAHFDSLASDFSYGLLVVAIAGLAAATVFARYSAQAALLKAKWE